MSASTPTTRSPRRTQGERSAETRERLLDATIESLIEVGYAHTTTTGVCERAGLSRGAQVHHFPKKAELVIQAVAHLALKQMRELRQRGAALPPTGDRTALLIDIIVDVFAQPLFYAAIELWVAARTDPELLESLLAFERSAGRNMSEVWREFAPAEAHTPDFDDLMELSTHLARGMALQKILRSDDTNRRRLVELWKRMAKQCLAERD